jgi:hypothetical protein
MSSAVCIIDTTVFCNIVHVPNRSQSRPEVLRDLKTKINSLEHLLLPVAVVIETGNHISQNGDGRQRRRTAMLFRDQVFGALNGTAPWRATPPVEFEQLTECLARFPDCAMRGESFGDLTIVNTYELQCQLNPARLVYIWSLDSHLSGYRREPILKGPP